MHALSGMIKVEDADSVRKILALKFLRPSRAITQENHLLSLANAPANGFLTQLWGKILHHVKARQIGGGGVIADGSTCFVAHLMGAISAQLYFPRFALAFWTFTIVYVQFLPLPCRS